MLMYLWQIQYIKNEVFGKVIPSLLSFSNLLWSLFVLLAILNDSKVKGYSINTKTVKSSTPLQVMPPAPVKLLAYADNNMLVLVNSSAELQAIKDYISCYDRASNSRVNCHKLVAFPLSGDKSIVQPDLFRLSRRLGFQWQDSNSLS